MYIYIYIYTYIHIYICRCGAKDRNNGERSSTFGSIAKILGGSGSTKSLKSKGYYAEK